MDWQSIVVPIAVTAATALISWGLALLTALIKGKIGNEKVVQYLNGAIGIVEGTACVYPKNLEETLSIFGGTGTAVIGGLAVNRVQTWNFETPAPQDDEVAKINGTDPKDVYGSGHTPLYANYIHAIENGVDPLVSGTEAIKAMKIILAAYRSQKTGQPVKFDDLEFSTLDMQDSDVRWHRG